jgi:hypothetical protein
MQPTRPACHDPARGVRARWRACEAQRSPNPSALPAPPPACVLPALLAQPLGRRPRLRAHCAPFLWPTRACSLPSCARTDARRRVPSLAGEPHRSTQPSSPTACTHNARSTAMSSLPLLPPSHVRPPRTLFKPGSPLLSLDRPPLFHVAPCAGAAAPSATSPSPTRSPFIFALPLPCLHLGELAPFLSPSLSSSPLAVLGMALARRARRPSGSAEPSPSPSGRPADPAPWHAHHGLARPQCSLAARRGLAWPRHSWRGA